MSHRTSTLVVFGDSLSDNGNLFDLIGFPQPPAWEGRSSNGPVYAEQLASFLHMRLDDRAFAGAEASDLSPPLIVNPEMDSRSRSICQPRSRAISQTLTASMRRKARPR